MSEMSAYYYMQVFEDVNYECGNFLYFLAFTKGYAEIKKVLKNTFFYNVFMKGIIISGSNESC